MKVIVKVKNIKGAIPMLEKLSNRVAPIYKNVLIKTTDNEMLEFITSDLESTLKVTIPCKIEIHGTVLIGAKLFYDYIRSINEDEISLVSLENKFLKLSGKHSNILIPQNNSENFVEEYKLEEGYKFVIIKSDVLKDALSKTLISIEEKDINKFILRGIFIEILDDNINFVSSDSFRITLYKGKYIEKNANGEFIIFANNTAKNILDILKKCKTTDVIIQYDTKNIRVTIGPYVLTSILLHGKYLNYKLIIVNSFFYKIFVDKDKLYNVIKKILPIIKNNNYDVVLSVDNKNDCIEPVNCVLKITVDDTYNNVFIEEKIPCKSNYDYKIKMNGKFIYKTLKNIKDNVVVCEFNSNTGMMNWHAENENTRVNFYIMPKIIV